jgi:hypothetical protein
LGSREGPSGTAHFDAHVVVETARAVPLDAEFAAARLRGRRRIVLTGRLGGFVKTAFLGVVVERHGTSLYRGNTWAAL